MKIPLAKIGPLQLKDVEHSGLELHNDFARTCTVLQGDPPTSDIGDNIPHRITALYGHNVLHWNRHFVVQVAGCPFSCQYCYVDNLREDALVEIGEIVDWFETFRKFAPDLNVFHLMGGCPGRYAPLWLLFRQCLDRRRLGDVILLSDVILVEHFLYGVEPWKHIPWRSIVSVCLKGTTHENFWYNTGSRLFEPAVGELSHYLRMKNTHFTMLNPDDHSVWFDSWLMKHSDNFQVFDYLRVKEYEVVKDRKAKANGL